MPTPVEPQRKTDPDPHPSTSWENPEILPESIGAHRAPDSIACIF